jgi:hypothetical protein
VNLANDASSLKRLHKMWQKDFQDARRVDLISKKARISPGPARDLEVMPVSPLSETASEGRSSKITRREVE